MEPKAQLRLVSGTIAEEASIPVSHDSSMTDASPPLQQRSEMNEVSEVLMTPRFIEDDAHSKSVGQDAQYHATSKSQLKAIHQAVVLAQCLLLERIARNDELQSK